MTVQYFNEQAIRAERLARSILDERACEALNTLAREYREMAEAAARANAPSNDGADHRVSC
jgi:hypothetical protein